MGYLDDLAYSQIPLQKLHYAAQGAVTEESLYRVRAEFGPFDKTLRHLMVKVEREVMAHRVATDERVLTVDGRIKSEPPDSVLVDLPQSWWRRLLRLKVRSVWCTVVGHAGYQQPWQEIGVEGTVTVPVEHFHTFPLVRIPPDRYPGDFGNTYALVQVGDPSRWNPEPVTTPEQRRYIEDVLTRANRMADDE